MEVVYVIEELCHEENEQVVCGVVYGTGLCTYHAFYLLSDNQVRISLESEKKHFHREHNCALLLW